MNDHIVALKPHQWIKNLFIFLPLVFGKKLFILPVIIRTGAGFFLFCLASSAAYLINDVIDAQKDAAHPMKRSRPVASGKVKKAEALCIAFVLGLVSCAGAFTLSTKFGWVLVFYLVFNVVYSKLLKEEVIVDVFCIGFFFIARIMAGSFLSDVAPSYWVILMTFLLALFLGFNKRRQELLMLEERAVAHRLVLSHYNEYFIDVMTAIIASSIVVLYMFYAIDARTVGVFGTWHLVYTIPFVYYGMFRYLYLIHKHNHNGDPTHILLSDGKMQANLLLWVFMCIAVIYYGL